MKIQPLFHKFLRLPRKVSVYHLHCLEVEYSKVFSIQRMYMAWLVFFGLEEHFNDYSVKSNYLGHKLSDLSSVYGTNIENIWLTSKLL